MRNSTLILVITSAVMVGGAMAVADDIAEVTPEEAQNANFIGRGKARLGVPGVDYDPADYPDAINPAAPDDADDEPAPVAQRQAPAASSAAAPKPDTAEKK